MFAVAVYSYFFCAGMFTLSALILSANRLTRDQFFLLSISCGFTALWAALNGCYGLGVVRHFEIVSVCEMVSHAAWYICLIRLLFLTQWMKNKRWFLHPFYHAGIVLLLIGLTIASWLPETRWEPGFSGIYSHYVYIGHVIYDILVLAVLEQIYRGSAPEQRWGIRYLCLGLVLMYGYEFYMYANAALQNDLVLSTWQGEGILSMLTAPLLVFSAAGYRKWQSNLIPSRAVIFRSTVLVSCGIYLAFAGFLGQWIKARAGNWGDLLQNAFFVGALVVLGLMFLSGQIRVWTKVFLSRNFYKLRYDYREEWVRFSSLLFDNHDNRQLSKRVIKALADMVESPKGVLFEWEENRGYVLKDCWDHPFPAKECSIAPCAFTDYLRQSQRALELPSRLSSDERGFAFLTVPQEIRQFSWAWLLVPLMHGDKLHAFVLLAHPRTAFFTVNWEVLDLLSMAGRQAVISLVQEQNMQALAVARQFEGYHRVTTFVMHDLKNILGQLRLIQGNKDKHQHNPAFINSVFQTLAYNGDKIERLLLQIRNREQALLPQGIPVASALQKVIQLTNHRHPIPKLDWQIDSPDVLVKGDEERFINVLCHLIENAQEATPENGEVRLSVTMKHDRLMIAVRDTGCGMDPEFLHFDLYKPFVTTKGEKGMGIGVYEAREYAHACGGKLRVESEKGKGSTFHLELPLECLNLSVA